MIKEKKISILISTYNKSRFIKRTIKSCLDQKYKNYEIIIVDTQSSDGTDKIIDYFSYLKRINFFKIKRKYKNSPLNQIEAIKYGLSKSKGEIICLLDGDDIFKKSKLKEINKFFHSNKATNFVQDKARFNKNVILNKRKFLFFNILPNFFPTSTFSIKKKNLVSFLKNYSFSKLNLLEIDARLFFFSKFYKKDLTILNKILTIYRIDQRGISSKFKRFSVEWFQKRKQAHFFLSTFFKNKSYPYRIDSFLTNLLFVLIKKFN